MKIQFTQRLPLGSELHLGKERGCFRGIDLIHGPTYTGISGNFMIYKPKNGSLKSLHLSSHFPQIVEVTTENESIVHPAFSTKSASKKELLGSGKLLTLFPEKRYFFETSTTEVAIETNLLSDLYASIGTGCSRTGWYTTLMKLPFIFFIRIGFLLASLGGSKRLLRQHQKEKLEFGHMKNKRPD